MVFSILRVMQPLSLTPGFHHPEKKPHPQSGHSSLSFGHPSSRRPYSSFCSWIYLIRTIQVDEIVSYWSLVDWLLSLSMFASFIHVVACVSSSFHLWLNNISLYGYTRFCFSVHSLMGIWVVFIWGLYRKLCYGYSWTGFYVLIGICFHFSWVYT